MPSPISEPPPPPPSAREFLAVNMVRLRREKGWSQEMLAFECGLHRTFIAHVERQARNISLDNVERIARALGVPIHELLRPQPSDMTKSGSTGAS